MSPWLQACIYLKISLLFDDAFYNHPFFSMVLLLFHGNILSNPFCQWRCVYFKTKVSATRYIKRTGFFLRIFEGHCVYLRKVIVYANNFEY